MRQIRQWFKNTARSLLFREKASSERFVRYLRDQGALLGEDVCFYSPRHTLVDLSCPWLLRIGSHVRICHGVILLTHDYSWAVLKRFPASEGSILGAQSPVSIGDNVFIGMNAVITRGVTIGDHVVIGAGSIVTGDCESNSVYAGNPARRIMSIGEYRAKREDRQFEDARKMALLYRDRFGSAPPAELFREYFPLFCRGEEAEKHPVFLSQMELCGNFEKTRLWMDGRTPPFESYDAFLNACYGEREERRGVENDAEN